MTLDPLLLFPFWLLLLVGGCSGTTVLALWVTRPIESLTRSRRAPLQLALSDLLVLFAMLQMAVGTVHYLVMMAAESRSAGDRTMVAYIVDTLAAAFTLLCWWGGASMVSRAGIQQWWHRILVLVLVVPGGNVGSVVLAILVASTATAGIAGEFTAAAYIGCVTCLLVICVYACGLLTRWIVAKYPLDEVAKLPDSEQ